MDLTVAICTYKRPEMLRQTLMSLAELRPVSLRWEVLVVDNAGEAEARKVVETFTGRLRVRYEVEANLGASHARNHAVRSAAAPIVLFTDDDVTFDPRWLEAMTRAIHDHPDMDFWGGSVEPVWPAEMKSAPRWFDQERCPMLGDTIVKYLRGSQPRAWNPHSDPPFYTANLALRVSKVQQVGYFDTTVGHRGGVRVGMEDSLMVRAIAAAGGRGWYAADAVVHHPIPKDRLCRSYARSFAWRQGFMSVLVRRQEHEGKVPAWMYRASMDQLLRGLLGWIAGLATLNPGRAFAGQFNTLFNLSRLWHAWSNRGPTPDAPSHPAGGGA